MKKKNKRIIKGVIEIFLTIAVLCFVLYFSKKETITDWIGYVILGLWIVCVILINLGEVRDLFKAIKEVTGKSSTENDLGEEEIEDDLHEEIDIDKVKNK